jgi:hypothetical protein
VIEGLGEPEGGAGGAVGVRGWGREANLSDAAQSQGEA